jgi:signal transduction histidine kinase
LKIDQLKLTPIRTEHNEMLSSLRSRLLLTYALLIGVVLCVVGLALILFILRNPIIDRQVYARLESIAEFVMQQGAIQSASRERLEEAIQRIDQQANVRVLILSATGEMLLDSRADEAVVLSPKIREPGLLQRSLSLDVERKAWYTIWKPLGDNTILVFATPRVGRVSLLFSQRLGEILKDELLPPLLQGGLVALTLALVLSVWMSYWIASPLRQMSQATQQVAKGEFGEVPLNGPSEVKSLAESFNKMTHKVVASQQSQKDFMANVTHELKTPLTSIQGFAQALSDGTVRSQEEVEKAAEVILTEAGRMHRLVMALLDLARLEAGIIQMEFSTILVDELLNQIADTFQPLAAEAGVELIYSRTNLPDIAGDGDRLRQVFNNLVDNAIKFTPAGGKVTLSGEVEGDYLVVRVEDTGPGIPPGEISRIFERFYQVDKSRAGNKGRGTGLGLAIAREIVLAHGGQIQVESQAGESSCFMVKIPLRQPRDSVGLRKQNKRVN